MSTTETQSEFPPPSLRPLLQDLSTLLREKGESVSVAETAAGGIISASLLSIPGASAFYKGGVTLYTLPSRVAFGWTQSNITDYKGPTRAIVAGLAENIRSKLASTYTVAESGTAGPTGGRTPNREPDYVILAVATERGTYTRERFTGLGGDREANMVQFAMEALLLLMDVINGDAEL